MGSAKPVHQEKHVHFQTETEADVNATFEPKDKTGWYYSELGERWYKTRELIEKKKEQKQKMAGEASEPTISDTTISAVEEAAIHAEVREIMQKKFTVGRATLGTNLGSHHEDSVKSGTAIPSTSIIDLVTKSTQPSGKTPPSIIPGSLVSVASAPSHVGNGGSAPGFSH